MSTSVFCSGTVRNRLVFALFLLLLFFGNAWAAPEYKVPISRKVNGLISYWHFEGPVEQPGGRERLELRFSMDKQKCRDAYGEDGESVCRRNFGRRPAPEVTITPPMPGRWEWSGDRLLFFPEKGWPVDTAYQVDISRALPPRVAVSGAVAFRSAPLRAKITGSFKFDPENLKTMAVSGEIRFNTPVDKTGVESRFSAVPQGEGLLLGKPVLHFNGDDRLDYSLPVLRLAANDAGLRVSLAPGFTAVHGGPSSKGEDFFVRLPTIDNLFTLNAADLSVATRPDLRAQMVLALHFSLPVKPSEVLDKLDVRLLPPSRESEEQRQPDNEDEDGDENKKSQQASAWTMEQLTPEIIAQAPRLALQAVDEEDKPSTDIFFAIADSLETDRSLLLCLPQGLTSAAGLHSGAESRKLLRTPAFPEALRIMQKGGVLALTGDAVVSIYSRNLDAVDYEVAQIRPEFLNTFLLANLDQLDYDNYDYDQAYTGSRPDLDNLSVISRGSLPLQRRDAMSAQFSALNLRPLLRDGQKGLFYLSLTGRRDADSVGKENRFVLMTDLGLIHKTSAQGGSVVYAVSLADGKPRGNVNVRVIGANGLPVFSARTDARGKAVLPSLAGFTREKRPLALAAAQGSDLAFLPLEQYARKLNYSRFDVGGNRLSDQGINAYLFSQRGMYRPGESLHFGYLVKQGQWGSSELAGLPLRATLYNPRGNKAASKKITLTAEGFGELSFPLEETAPTGPWELRLSTADDGQRGEVLRVSRVMVEEFQPETLRLQLRLTPGADKGWLRPQDLEQGPEKDQENGLSARVNLVNLFGAPAVGHDVKLQVHFAPAAFHFREYADYNFYNAAQSLNDHSTEMPVRQTDDQGDAVFALGLAGYEKSTFRLSALAEGMDAGGGRSVMADASLLFSPLESVVGWRSDADLNYLPQHGKARLDLLVVDHKLAPVDLGELELSFVGISYTRSLTRDGQGQYRYQNLPRRKPLGTQKLRMDKKAVVDLRLDEPGPHLLEARDKTGNLVLRVPYEVAGTAQARLGEEHEARLTAKLSKQDYAPGETVEIALNTPYKGAGLITVEREDVLAETWFTAQAGKSVQRLTLPKGTEGRVYCNITYFRSVDDADIFTQPQASVVLPFSINMRGRDLGLSVRTEADAARAASRVVRPGQTLPVRVRAEQPSKAIVFAVDEGILQLTSYATPDPLRALLGDRALEVDTYQYFDLLMPEYRHLRGMISAFGGGEGAQPAPLEQQAALGQNPFHRPGEAPMVFWSGVLDVGPEESLVQIPVPPQFNGKLRIMAVGCAPGAVGAARTEAVSRAEVVIQPMLPLFVTPGDVFEASVSLTDMLERPEGQENTARRVALGVRSDGGCTLLDALPEPLDLKPARQQTVRLRFRAEDLPGGHTLSFIATPLPGQPGETVARPMGLSIRPALPRSTDVLLGRVGQAPYTAEAKSSRRLYPQFAELRASISALPLPLAHGLMRWLAAYPYGCTEQRLSAAFPDLTLLARPELTPPDARYTPQKIRAWVLETMQMLQARQLDEGRFATWPGGGRGDLFLSAYAADFQTTARAAGLSLAGGLDKGFLAALEQEAMQSPDSLEDARVKAYATWVLTRNGVLTSNILATLSAWLERYGPEQWRNDLTTVFMAGSWKLMKEDKLAGELIRGYRPEAAESFRADYPFDGLGSRALFLTVLAGQFPEELRGQKAQDMLDDIFDLAAQQHYTTISAAQAARALMAYSRSLDAGLAQASVSGLDQTGRTLALPPLQGKGVRALALDSESGAPSRALLEQLAGLSFTADAPFFWQLENVGFGRDLPTRAVSKGLSIRRELRTPEGDPVTAPRQGDEVVVAVIARAFDRERENIALVDMLPGCFEFVVSRRGESAELATNQGSVHEDRDMEPDYAERREDRMLIFTDLATSERVFRYRVKITGRGEFTWPPVQAEAMYDPEARALSLPEKIVIEE